MSHVKTHCAKCGGTLKTSVAESPKQYAPGCSPADDVAYLMMKSQQQLATNQMVTQVWNESMYAPDAPAIMLAEEQAQDRKRAFTVNQAQDPEPFEMYDSPPIMLRK